MLNTQDLLIIYDNHSLFHNMSVEEGGGQKIMIVQGKYTNKSNLRIELFDIEICK